VWTRDEVTRTLGGEDGEIVCRFYDVTEEGNFERKNILHRVTDLEQLSRLFGRSTAEIDVVLRRGRDCLLAERQRRVAPARDEKILTSWNALMIGAFAEAYKVLGTPAYRTAASAAPRSSSAICTVSGGFSAPGGTAARSSTPTWMITRIF